MAGYKKVGSEDFVNATTFNKQIERQRQAYQSRSQNDMGIATEYRLFPDRRQDVLDSSFEVFKKLDEEYNTSIDDPGNPDFNQNIKFDYSDTTSILSDINTPIDKPNLKGPNLVIPPDINNLSVETPNRVDSSFKNKGYGWRDSRNDPASESSTLGSYFKTHYSLNTSSNSPVFGEANDLGNDVIDYKQP